MKNFVIVENLDENTLSVMPDEKVVNGDMNLSVMRTPKMKP